MCPQGYRGFESLPVRSVYAPLVKLGKTFYAPNRARWRAWLAQHHRTAPEIFLVYYKKHSGKPRIPYNHAVEEALCYGWIDSILKPIDDRCYAQRFSPRRATSVLSAMNRERVRRLIEIVVVVVKRAHVHQPFGGDFDRLGHL